MPFLKKYNPTIICLIGLADNRPWSRNKGQKESILEESEIVTWSSDGCECRRCSDTNQSLFKAEDALFQVLKKGNN